MMTSSAAPVVTRPASSTPPVPSSEPTATAAASTSNVVPSGPAGSEHGSNGSTTIQAAALSIQQALPPRPIFSFYLGELSQYQVSSELYSPSRGRLCQSLCEAFNLKTEQKVEILATRTDLGQFHADNYLGLLQIASDLSALEADEKTRKRTKTEDNLVKERLAVFNLSLPSENKNSVFDGLFAYHRLCVSGSLGAAHMLGLGCDVAINWFGGHTRARKARAVGGCFVNDSVLTCLGLITAHSRVLHISMDFCHCDGVEEAFYTTDRVATLSFHSSTFPTGSEEDTGYGKGAGYSVNVPVDPACFTDDVFVPLFYRIVHACTEAFMPSAIIFVASPSVMAGNRDGELNLSLKGYLDCLEVVRAMQLPLIVLGGAGSSPSVAAIGWCAATARCLGQDLIGAEIPESCSMRDHFAASNFKLEVNARTVKEKPDTVKLAGLEARIRNRMRLLVEGSVQEVHYSG